MTVVSVTRLLLLFISLLVLLVTSGQCWVYHDAIWRTVRENYYTDIPPIPEDNRPIAVNLSLSLLSIIDVDEVQEIMRASWLTSVGWFDYRLAWNPSDYSGVSQIQVEGQSVWIPDIGVFNSLDESMLALFNRKFKATVYNDGYVWWNTAGVIGTSCEFDMKYFPFDDQQCSVHFETINSLNETILLAFQTNEEQIARDYFEENEQWTLKDTKSESGVRLGATNLVFTVLLTRKPTYFVINVVLPILILSLITLAVFWLPADSGEKVGLSVTIVLAFSVMQLVVADLIPRTSDTVPILVVYVFAATLLSALSLIASTVIVNLNRSSVSSTRPPRSLLAVARAMACVLCVDVACRKSSPRHKSSSESDDEDDEAITVKRNGQSYKSGVIPLLEVESASLQLQQQKMKMADDTAALLAELKLIHQDIAAELQLLTASIKDQDFRDRVKKDWEFLGRVLDRFLFWLFLLANVIILSAFLAHPLSKG